MSAQPTPLNLKADDLNYEFNVSGGQLRIRAYIGRGRNCTGNRLPRGPAAIEWITIDGSNYGGRHVDSTCLDENGKLLSDYWRELNTERQVFSIRATDNSGNAKRLAKNINGQAWWREADIQIGKPERREAWLSCIAGGQGASQECVEEWLENNSNDGSGGDGNSDGDGGSGGGDGRNETGQELEPTCESHGGPFGWALCVVFRIITEALDTFAGFVQDRLDVEIQDQDAVRGAWDSIRVIANVVFVMAFLVIIISQTIVGRF